VLSDLHLGTGTRRGQLNPLEDFIHDDRLVELLGYYDDLAGSDGSIELILNGDIFDLLKVKIAGEWPLEVTEDIAIAKLQQCLEGHPKFVRALREFLQKPTNRMTYLPGNHDLELWFSGVQELFLRYVAPGEAVERVHFVTSSDTYYLPEGIQIRHGHQFDRIHRVDYSQITRTRRDGTEVLALPWGSLWILEVMNPLKEIRSHIDRVQPLSRFLWSSVFLDPGFDRIMNFPRLVREEVLEITSGGYDERAIRALNKIRGAHTLIIGHSHGPRFLQLPNDRILVNTGTWVKMINLDLQHLGQDSGLTYAVIAYDDNGRPETTLMRWQGAHEACEAIPYAD
jgi:UDP-2,3-diacylglucosamine pyrophosphatase LpxH